MFVILQKQSTVEIRSVIQHAAISEGIEVIRQDFNINLLRNLRTELINGAMPVGSVHFVQECFGLIGIEQPEFHTYDPCIPLEMWGREICTMEILDALISAPIFIKPMRLKTFNGFIYRGDEFSGHNVDAYSEHDKEQIEKLSSLITSFEKVYTSTIVEFVAEWRCYITEGKLVAVCRYDDEETDYDVDMAFVNRIVSAVTGRTLAVDIGKTVTGEFFVVELNDAWAIGKYQGISHQDYFDFLLSRWQQITGFAFKDKDDE